MYCLAVVASSGTLQHTVKSRKFSTFCSRYRAIYMCVGFIYFKIVRPKLGIYISPSSMIKICSFSYIRRRTFGVCKNKFSFHFLFVHGVIGGRGGVVVNALRYKPAGRGFDSDGVI